jgi:hypothetical protein
MKEAIMGISQDELSAFNGNYIGPNGSIQNLDGGSPASPDGVQYGMSPFNGNYYGSDGLVHNIAELSGGHGGSSAVSSISIMLTAADWTEGAQVLRNEAIQPGAYGLILLAQGASLAQYDAFAAVKPLVSAQAAGSITVSALGTIPAIDLPIQLILLG